MADRIDSLTAAAAEDSRIHRIWIRIVRARFVAHAIAATVILVLIIPLVLNGPIWTSDEGAVRAQVEVIATEGSWSRVRPFFHIDPEGVVSPINASTISDDRYYPYTKRPAYPVLLVPVRLLFGQFGILLPSLVGTILAGLAGAQIAGLFSQRIRTVTFWVLVMGSPLFFYGYTATAHTLAAAASSVAMLVVLQASKMRGSLVLSIAGASMFLAVVLRTEAVLFGVALAIGIVVFRPLVGRFQNAVLTLVVAGSTVTAHVGSLWWAVQVAGEKPVSEGEGILAGARFLSGMRFSLVGRDLGGGIVLFAVMMTAYGCTLLALTLRQEPQNRQVQLVFAGVSVVGSVMVASFAPVVISGLVPAMPLLIAGLVLVRRSSMTDTRIGLILLVSIIFFAGVLITQDSSAGGLQWGGRYLLLAVPMLTSVAVASLANLVNKDPHGGTVLVSVLTIATVALSLNAALVLRAGHERSQELNTRMDVMAVEATYEVGKRPVIVSSNTHLGRHVWTMLDQVDFFLPPAEDFEAYLRRLAGEDIFRMGVFGEWDDDREAFFESLGYVKVTRSDPPFVIVTRADM